MSEKLPAVILAGGGISAELAASTGQSVRALVPIAGKTMLEYIVTALTASESVASIVIAGHVPEDPRYTMVKPLDTMVDNLFLGLDNIGNAERALLVTADIPFITPESIDDFVRRAIANGASFCYPIIPMEEYNKKYPSLKRTTLRIKDGTFTGGNIVLVKAEAIRSRKSVIAGAYAARKSVVKLGGMLGFSLLIRVVLSQAIAPNILTLSQLEAGVTRLMGLESRAIITRYPELGTDVDKPDDVAAAELILSREA